MADRKRINMDKFIFGITGPSGSGKTTVSDIFRDLGIDVLDADLAARAVVCKGSECLSELALAYGSIILDNTGELNRAALAEIVFSDKEKLLLLNKITHKHIKRYLEIEIDKSKSDLIAIDGAVIIGSPVAEMCRLLVVVSADVDIRLRRIQERDAIDIDIARNRINSQMTDTEYRSYADFIIENNDDNVRLGECVEDIYNKIKNISKTATTQSTKATKT